MVTAEHVAEYLRTTEDGSATKRELAEHFGHRSTGRMTRTLSAMQKEHLVAQVEGSWFLTIDNVSPTEIKRACIVLRRYFRQRNDASMALLLGTVEENAERYFALLGSGAS